ncbi:YbbR-like domain-containing protein [Pedobacter sp. HMF7647]|uniref:YbbR-like domain-containing protein n=1 Tax=Hufsiella arboris TaxID=2695275 RepID=A0A7K1YER1_9SPHI|nr:YbbR-like domain-containing protein [Hufsiella arboris]MXV52499.1 YbbR-like domain-containing protein [Hufsiella arboris]
MPFLSLTKTEQRRLSVFATCLGLAVLTWFFFALSGKYIYEVKTKINYVDLPVNRAFHALQSDTIKLQVQSTGWHVLLSKFRVHPLPVTVSLKNISKQSFVTLSDQLKRIDAQLPAEETVVAVIPDTLYYDFTSRTIKRVPVVLSSNLQFKKQWNISNKAVIKPSYVVVTGPESDLAKIKEWTTDSVVRKNVSSNVRSQVMLSPSPSANISIYPSSVDVLIPVDQFTEKIIEVPLKVVNPSGLNVRVVPEKVFVKVLTSLQNYQKITKNVFTATVDLTDWERYQLPQLPVRLTREPGFTKIISTEPQTVDFIVYK